MILDVLFSPREFHLTRTTRVPVTSRCHVTPVVNHCPYHKKSRCFDEKLKIATCTIRLNKDFKIRRFQIVTRKRSLSVFFRESLTVLTAGKAA